MKHATAGNAIILALFVTLLLVTLLLVQIVATKANLQMAAQRTNTAQLNVQSIFTVNSAMKRILAGLPGLASATLNASNLTSSGSGFQQLSQHVPTILPCTSGSNDAALYVALQSACGTASGSTAQSTTYSGVTKWQVPLRLETVTRLPDGSRRTRQTAGSLQLSSSSTGSLNVSAMQVLTNTIAGTVPGNLIFDGPVHANQRVNLSAGHSAWPGGLTSAAGTIQIGSTVRNPSQFQPNPSYACDQSESTCPNFSGGLNIATTAVNIPDALSTSAMSLPGNVKQVVLFPSGSGTGFFACTTTSCNVYQSSSTGIVRIQSGRPVPSDWGADVDLTPAESTVVTGVTQPAIYAPTDLQVRSLTPTAAAYAGQFTIIANKDLTVSSSLLASSPVCTTYPVWDNENSIHPATCDGIGSPDALGLISNRGDIYIGDSTSPLKTDENTLTLQANLLAPRGQVGINDSRLVSIDWIGALTADRFLIDARFRLAHDPRAVTLPGFPSLSGSVTPARVAFELERKPD